MVYGWTRSDHRSGPAVASVRNDPHTAVMGWWIVFSIITLLALFGLTYGFKGEEALEQARQARTAGGGSGAENSTPPDHADMSGWG